MYVCMYIKPVHNKKPGRGSKQTFLQRRHTEGYKALEKMFSIINY